MLDSDLAELYGVETRALVQAVKRNVGRFPKDFMFQLTAEEADAMRSQTVIASKRNVRYQPRAFTEHGVAMLSAVLNSERAVRMSIFISVASLFKICGKIFGNSVNLPIQQAAPPRRRRLEIP